MSYITRKMTIAINHHRHRCDTLYPACHLISSTYTAWPGFSFFTFFRRDNFSCFASFFPWSLSMQSIARSLAHAHAPIPIDCECFIAVFSTAALFSSRSQSSHIVFHPLDGSMCFGPTSENPIVKSQKQGKDH